MPTESLQQRVLRFGRAVIVGSGATLADFSVFEVCVRGVGMAPSAARFPALVTGACCQFFGNRSFTFRAQAGNLPRQAWLFLIFEALTLGLNWSVFHLLVTWVQGVPPELLGFLGTFLTFVGFAYPVRRWVIFRLPTQPSALEGTAPRG
ncbi:MAG TPA: GtrA family protein [Polyangiaceae bacterium]|nr:GtrA family protein [Polyangiaceae bacterium]